MVARHLVPAAALVLVIVPLAAFVAMGGCSDGKTPDCTSPDSGCGPDLDGAVLGDAPGDAASDVKVDAEVDAPPVEAGPDGAAD